MRPIWIPVSVSYSFLDNRTHLLHSAWEADLFAVVVDLSNWRDNSSSTAKTTLCEIFHFVEVDLTSPQLPVQGIPLQRRSENDV